MSFLKNVLLRRTLRIVRAIAILLIAGYLALMSVAWVYHFYPNSRYEVLGPGGTSKRAFTENCGFVDITILIRASDWPWTFQMPPVLGELYWPEVQKSASVHWSRDGSVIAFQKHLNEDTTSLFDAAYDYRLHRLIRAGDGFDDRSSSNRQILALLNDRGGMGPPESGLDDFKSDVFRSGFPAWGWIAPTILIIVGVGIVRRLRGKRD